MNIIKEDQRTKEIQPTSMSISRNGLLGLFLGPYELLLINFDDPKIKLKESINKSLDPTFSQWNKVSNDYFALTQSNVCKIFDVIEMKKIQSLKGHNKPISSIDWHPSIMYSVATTCSDNNRSLCIWDIRNSKSPIHKLDNLIIQQIKWNNAKTHLFASSTNSEIRVWDDRKLLSPVNILSAHTGNINDFDWHLTNKNMILSCGQDKKLKIWNYVDGNPKLVTEYEEESICYGCKFDRFDNAFTFNSPDTPGGNQISYWDIYDFSKLCSTPASSNTITHFELRNSNDNCCQFVTLHRNFDFKIWDINKSIHLTKRKRGVSSYGGIIENSAPKDRFYLSPSPDNTINKSKAFLAVQSETFGSAHKNEMLNNMIIHRSDPNLIMRDKSSKTIFEDQEMRVREFDKLINTNQVTFDKNPEMKNVIAHFNLMNIKCSIQFIYRNPIGDNAFLDVIVLQNRAEKIRPQNLDDLEKLLKVTIDDCRRNQISPIEKCVDVALEYLNKLSSRFSLRTIRSLKDPSTPMHSFNSLSDFKVPFPRICGASFSPSGLLVCFLAPDGYMSRFHNIPRSLSEITKLTNSSSSKGFFYELNKNTSQKQYHKSTIRKLKSTEFNIETPLRKLSSQSNQKQQTHIILIYNALPLSLFNLSFAKKYSINVTNIESMCENNFNVVSEGNRKDLIEFWQYCIILANGCKPSYNMYSSFIKPWAAQSMGRGLCEMWMNHFIKINDIQSAAMLIIVMRAIDTDLENFYRENTNNTSSISLTTASHKNISQESLMENIHQDNLMLHYPVQNCAYHPTTLNDSSSRNTLSGPGRFRNNSLGDSELMSNIKKIDFVTSEMMQRDFQINEQTRLIDPIKNTQYNRILLHYVHILTAQKLLNVSAKIIQKILHTKFFNAIFGQYNFDVCFLKNYSNDTTRSTLICTDCTPRNVSIYNSDGSKAPIMCSVCRNYVRGLFSVCDQCNHGGHVEHLNAWFSRSGFQAVCPTGCGCVCLPSKDAYHDLFIPIHLPTM